MNKHLKKVLVAGASLLMLTSVGAGLNSGSMNAHAAWREEDQYPSKFNKLLGNHGNVVNHSFWKHGYYFNVYTTDEQYHNGHMGDLDPIIVGIDGNHHVTNHQVWRALEGHRISLHAHHYHKHAKKHARRHARKHYLKHAKHHVRKYSHYRR